MKLLVKTPPGSLVEIVRFNGFQNLDAILSSWRSVRSRLRFKRSRRRVSPMEVIQVVNPPFKPILQHSFQRSAFSFQPNQRGAGRCLAERGWRLGARGVQLKPTAARGVVSPKGEWPWGRGEFS